ncbi:hypothetical protein GGTG_09559 [Gaeumannomyces tritici R3-111a-1]|uniref:Thioester reductase (TE) domain-containing protein n=1 Tax=Gaeumannomyces tritici (strain R3-111a-1) TaxID=644352 RepID=J3P7R7_GAET3|nr:hypothetical protein GGTG_09559 [Gaeumannomyces tritici R3-111a-1]EJT72700.1 hypothetical protein GGTG_09559 [Gaeumannomyces tritici R3-111a-1]
MLRTRLSTNLATRELTQTAWSTLACSFRFVDSTHGEGASTAEFEAMSTPSSVGPAPRLSFWFRELSGLPDEPLPLFPTLALVVERQTTNNLGLSQAGIKVLIGCVDFILHAGAQGSCLNTYASIRDPSVRSTGFLAALGLAASHSRPTRFHLVSSVRAILFSGKNEYPEVSMIADGVLGDNGGGGGAEDANTTPGVKYMHHTTSSVVPVRQFQPFMDERLDRPLRWLQMMEWTARVEEAGFLRAVCEVGEARYPKLLLLGSGIAEGK